MGFPWHNLFKKEVKSIVDKFRDDCTKFENSTENTSVRVMFDGEKLRYSIKSEDHEIGFVTPTTDKEAVIELFSEISQKFEKVQIEMTASVTNIS